MPEKSRKPANKAIPRLTDLVVRIAPEYLDRTRGRGEKGFIVVACDIGENGSVLAPGVVASSPAGVFDRAALAAVMKWKYHPRMVDGSAVSVAGVQSKITFALRE